MLLWKKKKEPIFESQWMLNIDMHRAVAKNNFLRNCICYCMWSATWIFGCHLIVMIITWKLHLFHEHQHHHLWSSLWARELPGGGLENGPCASQYIPLLFHHHHQGGPEQSVWISKESSPTHYSHVDVTNHNFSSIMLRLTLRNFSRSVLV